MTSNGHASWMTTAIDLMPLGVVIFDADQRIVAANPAACASLGLTNDQLTGRTAHDPRWRTINEGGQPMTGVDQPSYIAYLTGQPVRNQIMGIIHPDSQQTRWLKVDATPEFQPSEIKPFRVCVLFEDITERRAAEAELREANTRFTALFEQSPIGVALHRMIYDESGKAVDYLFLEANRNYQSLTGVDPRGMLVTEAFPGIKNDPFDWIGKFDQVVRSGETLRFQQHLQVNNRWYDCVGYRTGPGMFVAAFLEITEQKRAEIALRTSEENLRITLESIGDAVIATDATGHITRMNHVAEILTGWTIADAQGQSLTTVFRIVNALTRVTCDNPVERVLSTGQVVGLANHTVLINRNGNERQIADSGAPIRNDAGQVVGVVLVFRDVTDEYALQEQLTQARKLDALGQLAGGVAHDFNNMLAGIISAAELLKLRIDDASKRDRLLEIILSAAERAADLTRKLLAFARKGHVSSAPARVHEALANAVALLEHSIDKRIVMSTKFTAVGDVTEGDVSALQNVFLNLGINAAHAMPTGGELRFATRSTQLDPSDPRIHAFELPSGSFIEVLVQDTGCGIAPEHLTKIFDPFFTTKAPGQGTGLGLTAAYGTIRQHRGAISVSSELGKGTTFTILLPLSNVAWFGLTPTAKPSIVGSGRILLVDDEDLVRSTAKMILEHYGYTVVEATNGAEALRHIAAEPNGFALVILDMIMPVMDGRTCCEKMRAINPNVRVLLCSGHSQEQDLAALESLGIKRLIRKPFRETELATAVAEVLR